MTIDQKEEADETNIKNWCVGTEPILGSADGAETMINVNETKLQNWKVDQTKIEVIIFSYILYS